MNKIIIFLGVVIIGLGIFGVSTLKDTSISRDDIVRAIPTESAILFNFSTSTKLQVPCLELFATTEPETITAVNPPSDWLEFNEKSYRYSFKYPADWKTNHIIRGSYTTSGTKIISDNYFITIEEFQTTDGKPEANGSICDKSEYYKILMPYNTNQDIVRTKKADQYEMSKTEHYNVCLLVYSDHGCSDMFEIGDRYFMITYHTDIEGPFDQKVVKIMDSIISTIKPI